MTAVYAAGDPRAQLVSAKTPAVRAEGDEVLPFQHYEFHRTSPHAGPAGGSRSWIYRAQNVVLVWTDLAAGDRIERDDVDEVMLIVLDSSAPVVIETSGERAALEATAIAILPPGTSKITATGDVSILRLFALSAVDLVAASNNAGQYVPTPTSIAVTEAWPQANGGDRLRIYTDLDDIEPSPQRMGRIFRNRHVMVNLLYPRIGPRDPRTLSPHDHDDFEQLSLVVAGEYVHHIRAHWGKDRLQWREDEHVQSTGPSLAIIPPPLIHTSEAVGNGANRMIDIFAGPRADFSARAGWVLNADDYPAPEGVV